MSVYKIRHAPAPILRTVAFQVTEFDRALRRLLKNLWETLRDAHGLGLAAPQIGQPLRVAVIAAGGFRAELVNPKIVTWGGFEHAEEEGCLSLPGKRLRVARYPEVTVQWQNGQGVFFTSTVHGLAARCAQHEVDHLDGVLLTDRAQHHSVGL